MQKTMADEKKTICVTGFGPFSYHKVNDSWEAVQKLKDTSLEEDLPINLHIREIPVTYKDSENIVTQIWESLKPDFVVHVGVHNTDNVAVEKLARKGEYFRPDVKGCLLDQCFICGEGDDVVCTKVDLEKIVDCAKNEEIDVSISDDAGLYLCEYTYYLSLLKGKSDALFIHIPPSTSLVPLEAKVKVIETIIRAIFSN